MADETKTRWQHIDAIFDQAIDVPVKRRATFLDAACAGDAELRREVEDLLDAHAAAGSFLDTLADWMRAQKLPSLQANQENRTGPPSLISGEAIDYLGGIGSSTLASQFT